MLNSREPTWGRIDLPPILAYLSRMHLSRWFVFPLMVSLCLASGCVRVKTEPIRIEPIYIEITINHKIQRELDSVFAEIDQASETTEYEPLESK